MEYTEPGLIDKSRHRTIQTSKPPISKSTPEDEDERDAPEPMRNPFHPIILNQPRSLVNNFVEIRRANLYFGILLFVFKAVSRIVTINGI